MSPGLFEETWLVTAKPALAALALAVLWAAESVAPMAAGRARRVSHDAANLVIGLINAVVVALLFGGALLLATEWARRESLGLLHGLALPAWAAWPLALLLLDLWMYLWHVLNHRVAFLWRFHAVHHADREMDVSTAVRFHTGEIVLANLARLAVLPALGITMPQLLLYEAIFLPVILFHHSNIGIPPRLDALLRAVIATPFMHWVHHSRWQPETDSNYGSVLSVWDRLFRTFRLRADPREIALGLDEDREEWHWRTVRGIWLRPFRKHKRADAREET